MRQVLETTQKAQGMAEGQGIKLKDPTRHLGDLLGFAGSARADISRLKQIDRDSQSEKRMRFAALGGMAFLLWLMDGLWIPVVWVPLYFAALYLNSRFLAAAPAWVTKRGMALIAMLLLFDSLVYFAMAGYLWMQGGAVYGTLALLMVSGYMLNATTEHCEEPVLVFVDIVSSGFAVIAMSVALGMTGDLAPSVLVGAGLTVLWLYFSRSVLDTMHIRRSYREAQQRLTDSSKMEAIGHLTGGLAHEYNNMLAAVIGNLELAQSIDDPAEKESLTQAAQDSAMSAAQMTAQIMAVARRAHIQPEVIPVSTVFQSLWPRLRRTLPLSVSLNMVSDPPDLTVYADRTQLEQVLLELADNARDAFTGPGTLTLSATLLRDHAHATRKKGRSADGRAFIALAVADTGSGMTDDIRERATDPFFSTHAPGQSPGLGLAVARGVAEQLGGALKLESQVDKGTTVTLFLPSEPAPLENAQEDASPRESNP